MNIKLIGFIIIGGSIFTLLPFLYKFHGESLNDFEYWSSLGSYFSGILIPILTTINIWVFIKLTQAINNDDEQRKKKELDYQRKLIITQIRQQELDHFSKIMNNALVLKFEIHTVNITTPISIAHTYLESFIKGKADIFPIINDNIFQTKILRLHHLLIDYAKFMNKSFSVDTLNPPEKLPSIDYRKELLKLMDCKNEVVSEIQKFILNDICAK
ncbi:hypothetical protein [Butyricimonas paravirosa]|uniref:hypothetical protein n=1 Tax=Butyricimonas paravirosa TaxID=1472417 RepID=UPI0022E31C66|nr:hypothetical protein [Butyricimonas paravirosa]